MSAWTPDAITQLVIQLIALAGAVGAVIAAIQKLRGDVQQNTAVTNATNASVASAAMKVDEIHAATVTNDPINAPHG